MTRNLQIGLDAHMVGTRETGNETYVRGLVEGLSQGQRDIELYVYYSGSAWRPEAGHIHLRRLAGRGAPLRLAVDLPIRSIRDRLDVLHTTYTAPPWAAGAAVVTVHDITWVSHPEWFSSRDLRVLSLGVSLAIRRATRVITVSDICRAEIIEHYRVPEERVVSVPNAAGPAAQPISDSAASDELARIGLNAGRPYVLAVGNLQPKKNLIRLVAAFGKVVGAGLDADLVLVGAKHHRAEEVLAAARGVSGRVRFTGYLNDRQLAACYRCAAVFAFPSLFEGFGIPALEAMAHGVPVVCSDTGALPEVCGSAARYFDPLDVESIADALTTVVTDSALRQELVRAGHAREREFTWSRTADQTMAVYREAAA